MPNTLKYKINSKKSLCKSKKEKKCKKIKGCKMAKGPKKTICRKIKNKKYGKTIKKGGATPNSMQFKIPEGIPSLDSFKDIAIKEGKKELEKKLKENDINLKKEDLDELIGELSKLQVNEITILLEDLKKAVESGDEKKMIQTLTKNKKVREIGLKIMRKNPVLMAQVAKYAQTMKGGNYTEQEKAMIAAQKRSFTRKELTSEQLQNIMNDENQPRANRMAAQEVITEELLYVPKQN